VPSGVGRGCPFPTGGWVWAGCCGRKTADWVWMPFRVVSGVGRGIGVLNGGGDCRKEMAVLRINVEHHIITNGEFVA